MESQGIGWLCGAFSNPETFSASAAQTFVSAGNAIGMGISFVYPGNAKNYMLESSDSGGQGNQYIERTMLAAIYGHGNVFGPDIEYVPHLRPRIYPWHKWGPLGVMRWVFISGCDALGFPVNPAGKAVGNSQIAPPTRWSGSLAGISGMCGYRSESWYVPGFQALMPFSQQFDPHILQVGSGYAQTLINQLNGLNTFWGSWIQAASWLHGQLGHQAQPVCFVNTPGSLGEHLKNYLWNRQPGLDLPSIQWTTVGSGAPPVYEPGYCPTCDNTGNPTCPAFTPFAKSPLGDITISGMTDFDSPALPVFRYIVDDADLEFANALGVGLDTSALANTLTSTDPGSSFISRYNDTNFSISGLPPGGAMRSLLTDTVDRLVNRVAAGTNSRIFGETIVSDHGLGMSEVSRKSYIQLGKDKFPVLFDNGISVWDSAGLRTLYGSLWHLIDDAPSTRRLPDLMTILKIAASARSPYVKHLHVTGVDVAYVKSGNAYAGLIVPAVRVSVTMTIEGASRQSIVVLG